MVGPDARAVPRVATRFRLANARHAYHTKSFLEISAFLGHDQIKKQKTLDSRRFNFKFVLSRNRV